ncbi:hypothetical protein GGI43DRAFT_7091 [Trichoderma evansii]
MSWRAASDSSKLLFPFFFFFAFFSETICCGLCWSDIQPHPLPAPFLFLLLPLISSFFGGDAVSPTCCISA